MIPQEPGGEYTNGDIARIKMVAGLCKGSVLDVGCGRGELWRYLPGSCYNYLGIDPHPVGWSIIGDVYDLSKYRDPGYDTVVLMEVLEHLEDPSRAMKEISQVVRERLIISVPNPFNTDQIASVLHNGINIVNRNHVALFGDNEIINLCRNAGFSYVDPVRFYTKIPGLNWLSPIRSRFGEWNIYVVT